jgi:class 3 adenylate cyclase
MLRIKALNDTVQAQSAQLAEWNTKLEKRVTEQLSQLESLSRLKRFFSGSLKQFWRAAPATCSQAIGARSLSCSLTCVASPAFADGAGMCERVNELSIVWRRQGYALGLGIGIAQGFATIGAIGFEGRLDYGAVGTVTNLAARLCDEERTNPDRP